MLLAGDIGGTKTTLGIFSLEKGPREPMARATLPSGEYPSLEALVSDFLRGVSFPIRCGSFGVAGPVIGGKARVTNLPWVMKHDNLAKALSLESVRLLNDLEAIAYGIPHLDADDLHTINQGRSLNQGAIAVIAPGTGLGLHFAEQVAHAHGGRVDLVSEEGRGCVFTLRLPALPPAASPGLGPPA